MKKRIVSLLLVFCMVITLVPANVLADEVKGLAETTAGQTQTAGTTAAKPENPFADVKSGSWYEAAVLYARANGFFDGTSATTFEPDGPMTRAMFVTVLGRMAGVEAADYAGAMDFIDVAEGTWYAPFVKWAARYGITTGTGSGKFSPDGRITREEMAVFFVRYFETFNAMPKADTTVTTKPADLDKVSSWAQDAVGKLWALGLLNGDGVNFAPRDKATRAQTAALCQRTDKAVETWYSEPGVKSERVSVEPGSGQESGDKKPEEQKPSGGGSSGGSSGGGTTVTTHYEVSFVVEGASMPKSTVAAGTRISSLSTPTVEGKVFLGWYYDSALTRAAGTNDTVNQDTTLYAKLGEVMAVNANEAETPNYVTVTVPAANVSGYTFGIRGYAEGCIDSFINVTANNAEMKQTGDTAEPYRYTVSGTAVSPVLAQGQTYRVELKADSDARFVVDGAEQAPSVRVLNIVTEKGTVDHLKLADGVKLLPASSVSDMTGTALDGLFTASAQSGSVEQNENTGTFRYTGDGLAVGDTVAIYEGASPDQRTIATSGTSADGAVAYVQITAASGNTYTYKTADSEDVLFTPDVLPVSAAADKVADDGSVLTVDKLDLTFTDDKYADMGLDSQTTIDVGDYLALYTGDTAEGASGAVYGRITAIREIELEETACYEIKYDAVSQDEVFAAMDLYSTRNEEIELSSAQRAEIEADMERQAIESGFVEEASQYLAALAMETDGFRELSDDLDMDLSSYSITYADGTPVSEGDMALMAGRAQITEKTVEATVAAGYVLQHFDGSSGVRAELAIRFKVDVGGKLEIVVQAIFEQEVLLSVNTSGGAIWKWKWIFPYIYDYQLNANIDLGTYTGIGITATAKTVGGEDEDFDWAPVTGNSAESKILNIGQQITELMEKKEEFLGQKLVDENGEEIEWSGTNGGSLADKYSAMMEDAEDNWVELFRREIFSKEGPVDKLHILVYGISADFVVSANVYVTLGMTFTYSTAKRYNFSLQLFHKQSTNQTIDLEEPNYNFDFYVMGTIGIRAGVEFEIGIGLFSLRLDSIGITAEAGAYARLWGYFYYHLSWTKSSGKDSNASGAMFVEIGLYLKITFKAQLFSSDKLTYQPTLYENEWPLWSAGAQENVYGFLDGGEDCNIVLTGQRSTGLPQDLFRMSYMDMKTGEQFGVLNDEGALEDEDKPAKLFGASSFTIDISNPKFRYDGNTNTVTVTPGDSTAESCDIRILWKNAPLAFTDRPISRTVHIDWSDPAEARYIAFDTRGGSLVSALSLRAGAAVRQPVNPTRQGYDFAGWYTDRSCTTPFDFPSTMPDYYADSNHRYKGITVYAKWTPRDDTKYTVEHYKQTVAGGYELAAEDTQTLLGTTEGMTAAAEKSYTGFQLKKIEQTTIMPDGSSVAKVYYDRELYPVTFAYNVAGLEGSDMVYRIRYEGTVYPPRLTLGGYDFAGYEDLTLDESGGLKVTQALRFNATWTPRTDTPYRVEYYTQSADGRGYLLLDGEHDIVSKTGETDKSLPIRALADARDGLTLVRAKVNGTEVDKTTGSYTVSRDGRTVVKLYYDRVPVMLHFVSNGGSDAADITKGFGMKVVLPTPVREGYRFDGWFTDSALTEPFTARVMPDRDTTLYAKWTALGQSVTVRHNVLKTDGSGYEVAETEQKTDVCTDDVLPLAELVNGALLVPDGIEYREARVDGTVQTSYTVSAAGGAVDLYYDRVPHTLTWDFNGGTVENDDYTKGGVLYGTALVFPAVTKAGYGLRWSAEEGLTMPAHDLTITADWEAGAQTMTVRHNVRRTDGNGYDAVKTEHKSVRTEETMTLYSLASDTVLVEGGITYREARVNGTVQETYTVPASGLADIDLYYERVPYALTWVFNGGTAASSGYTAESSYVVSYDTVILTPTLEKTGYAFAGWYTDETYTAPMSDGMRMPAHDVTLYAKWTAGTATPYRVEYYQQNADDDGYTETDAASLTGVTGEPVTAAEKRYTDFHFNAEKSTTGGTVAADGSLVLRLYYDRDTYTVTFHGNGGTPAAAEVTFKVGQTIRTSEPVNDGYAFTGWYTEAACETAAPTVMPAQPLTLYAGWRAGEVNYKVLRYEMDLNGQYVCVTAGEGTVTGVMGSSLALGTLAPGKEGFTFVRATNTLSGGVETEISAESVSVAKGMTVKLYYSRNKYTIQWDLAGGTAENEGSYTTGEVYYGTPIVQPANPKRFAYTHSGWKDKTSGTAAEAIPETMPARNLSYGLSWTRGDATYELQVFFMDLQGQYPGEPDMTRTVRGTTPNTAIDLTKITESSIYSYLSEAMPEMGVALSEGGFAFERATANGEAWPESLIFDHDGITVQLYYERCQFNLTWDLEPLGKADPSTPFTGGANRAEPVYYGTPIVAPKAERTGYSLNCWFDPGTNKSVDLEGMTMPAKDLTYKVEWKTNKYTISFDFAGGHVSGKPGTTSLASVNKEYDSTYKIPVYVSRDGYDFVCWRDQDGTEYQAAGSVTVPAKDLTLTAVWTPLQRAIQFQEEDGTAAAGWKLADGTDYPEVIYLYETGAEVPAPVRTGYHLAGWYANGGTELLKPDSDGVLRLASGNADYAIELTLKAAWEANSYSIRFDANGGAGTMPEQDAVYDMESALTGNTFEKKNYSFKEWNTEKNGGGTAYADGANVLNLTAENGGTVTLYAQWEPTVYTVTYELNGGTAGDGCPATYTVESETATLGNPTKENCNFMGWYTTADFAEGTQITELPGDHTENLKLYAKWEHLVWNISYELGEVGSVDNNPNPTTVNQGESFTLMPLSKTGWKFLGWALSEGSTAIDGSTDKAGVSYRPTGNTTLYALWEHPTYTVTFKGGTETTDTYETLTKFYGEIVKLPTPRTTNSALEFAGWRDALTGREYDPSTNDYSVPERNATLQAVWRLKGEIKTTEEFLALATACSGSSGRKYKRNTKRICVKNDIEVPAGTQLDLSDFTGEITSGSETAQTTITMTGTENYKPLFGNEISCKIYNINIAFENASVTADGMYTSGNNYSFWGVFGGTLETGGILRGCTVNGRGSKSVTISLVKDAYEYVGGLVGSNGGTIQNCGVGADTAHPVKLIVNNNRSGDLDVGGLAGYNSVEGGLILYDQNEVQINENGSTKLTVSMELTVAGIRLALHAGGIAGYVNRSSIEFRDGSDVAVYFAHENQTGKSYAGDAVGALVGYLYGDKVGGSKGRLTIAAGASLTHTVGSGVSASRCGEVTNGAIVSDLRKP